MASFSRKTVAMGLAALTLAGGVAATFESADARPRVVKVVRYGGGYYRPNYGGAIAAGVIGGLALGGLAAAAAAPVYAAPVYAAPVYGAPVYGGCRFVSRQVVDAWGRVVVRQTQVC